MAEPTPDLSQLSDEQLHLLYGHLSMSENTPEYLQRTVKGGVYAADTSTPEWQAKYGPLSGMGEAQQVLVGTGRGMTEVGRQAGNVAGLESKEDLAEAHRLDQPLLATGAGQFGNVLGQAAVLTPATAGGEYAAGLTAAGARLLARPVLTGALEGAGQGALMAGPDQRGVGALTGALTGGALPAATGVGRRAIYGAPRTPEAQLLLDQGVPLTPGQMNPSGTANLLEQSVESVPFVGPTVKASREAAEQDFGRAVIQRGAAPGARIRASENVSDMYDQAAASWDPVYAQVHGYPMTPQIMRVQGGNIPLTQAFSQAARTPGLTPARQKALDGWLQARLKGLPVNPSSEDLIGLRSALRTQQRNLLNTTDVNAPLMRQAYEQAEHAVTDSLNSQLPPQASQILQNADRGYAQLKVIGNAVSRSGDQLQGLTPAKLSLAIRQAIDSSAYARGAGGDLRDLARAGTRVFQTVSPPTGARVATGLGAGALAYASPHVALPLEAAAGTAGLLGAVTPLGRRLAAGQTAPQTTAQRLVNALQSRTPDWVPELAALSARTAINLDPRAQATARALPGAALMLLPNGQLASAAPR